MALDRSPVIDCHDDGEECDDRGDHLDVRCNHGLRIFEFYSPHFDHDRAIESAGERHHLNICPV